MIRMVTACHGLDCSALEKGVKQRGGSYVIGDSIVKMSPLDPEALTWTGLLTQWLRFAQASLALPNDAEGQRWRKSVPAIINLQAVTFALADLDRLQTDEHPLALDKAELLIRSAQASISETWEVDMPDSVSDILLDAHAALRARRGGTAPSGEEKAPAQ